MLGQDVARLAGDQASALSRAELDITNAAAVDEAFAVEQPQVVLNCAAYTNVDGAEQESEAALRVNRDGAANVAAAAARVGAAVAYVSSDYVFDGSKREPWLESDPTGPLSSYGRSKLEGELATAAANERHFIVRSSWLFGAAGPNFVDTMLRLAGERDELRVVHDQVGSPTYTGHLAEGLLELAGTQAYGVHHMAGAGSCSWFELAGAIFERAEVDCRLEPCTTAEFPRPAPRPAYSVLGRSRADTPVLPSWQEGLEAYLGVRV